MSIERFPIEASHIMMFARAIGDMNNDFGSDLNQEATCAPPTFMAAGSQFDSNYQMRPKVGVPWIGSGRQSSDAIPQESGTLHAEQAYEYHVPVRPGMILTMEETPGEAWEKESRRGGVLKFQEVISKYRDQNGELIVTARTVAVTPEHSIQTGE